MEKAKARIAHFPALRWLVKSPDVRWTLLRDAVAIDAHENTPPALAKYLPINVFLDGRVEIAAMGIADYPDAQARRRMAEETPPDAPRAVAFLCNRFYQPTGHTFLYLHYPATPEKDALVDIDWGKNPLGHAGLLRTVKYNHFAVDTATDARPSGASSFIGFPISAAQADLIQADADLTICNPGFRYHLLNFLEDAVNCSGFAVTRLQNVRVPMEHLTNHRVFRQFDNDHLPDHWITHPRVLHQDIGRRGADHPQRTTLEMALPRYPGDDAPHGLSLTRTGDGVLLGEIRSGLGQATGLRPRGDKYLVYDIRKLVDHVMPRVIDEKGQFRDLSTVEIPPLSLPPLSVSPQPLRSLGRQR